MSYFTPDRIIFEGEKRPLAEGPHLHIGHPDITKYALWNGTGEKSENPYGLLHSVSRRTYRALWEILGDQIYLKELVGRYHMIGNGPIFADWIYNTLFLPAYMLEVAIQDEYDYDVTIRIRGGYVENIERNRAGGKRELSEADLMKIPAFLRKIL